MTSVRDATVHVVEVPLTTSFSTSNKTNTSARLVLAELTAEGGTRGWGEAPLNVTFTAETPSSAREAIEQAAGELVVGRDVEAAAASLAELGTRLSGMVAARCALSMALWDLRGRLLGVPVYELLGGARRTTVPVAYHVGNFDDEQDVRDAQVAVDAGFRILKLKVGRADIADDLRAVERVRGAVGTEPRLYVDANQAWNRAQATAFVRHAAGAGVQLVEQPLPRWDSAGLAELSATLGVVVAADESIFSAEQLLSALTAGAAPGAVVVKALKAGGVEGARALLDLCALARVQPFLVGMCGDTSVGSAALLHIAAATAELPLGTAITPHFSQRDIAGTPLQVADGQLHLKSVDAPGFGVDVDTRSVEALRIG